MKKALLLLFALMLSAAALFAQAPQKMSYQAVVRNTNNTLVTNQNVSARISILQGSVNGTPVYVETHNATTNANGLLTLEVGDGNAVTGSMAAVDWANGPFFLKSEIDPDGGINYSIEGAQQLLSVPYALYASRAGNVPAFAIVPVDTTGYMISITQPGGQPQTFFLPNGTPGPQGPQGLPGNDGRGIVSITGPVSNDIVDTYTIHYSDNTTSTFTVTNGTDGEDGAPGAPGTPGNPGNDGVSPTITVVQGDAGMVLTITDVNGTNQYTIPNGGGSGGTLVQQQVNWNTTDPTSVTYILNKPNLATVATSGDYNDLTNKPTIPTNLSQLTNDAGFVTNQEISNLTNNVNNIQNTIDTLQYNINNLQNTVDNITNTGNINLHDSLASVAFTGDYNDLSNTPDLSNIGPGADGRGIANITGPQTSPNMPNVDIYTIWYTDSTTSTFTVTNGVDGEDGEDGEDGISPTITLDTLGSNLMVTITDANGTNTTLIPLSTGGSGTFTQLPADWNATSGVQQILNKPTNVSAFTNDAHYITEQNLPQFLPVIPENMSDLENDMGYISEQNIGQFLPTIPEQVKSDWNVLDTASAAYIKNKPVIPTVPTNVSAFTNDAHYITEQNLGQFMPEIPENLSDLENDMGYISEQNIGQFLPTIPEQVKSDWNVLDTASAAYIKNKPVIPTVPTNVSAFTNDAHYITEQNLGQFMPEIPENLSDLENDMGFISEQNIGQFLPTIPEQVKSDWNVLDTASAAYIKNKPVIPTVPTNVSVFTNDAHYITEQNLPQFLPETPVQVKSDWTEYDTSSVAYIKNKPTVYSYNDIQNMINNSLGTLNNRIDSLQNALNAAQQAQHQNDDLSFKCGTSQMYDYEGNAYSTVKIGTQCWMKENLRTKHFADGTAIDPVYSNGYDHRDGNAPAYSTLTMNNQPYNIYNMAAAFHGLPSQVINISFDQEEEFEIIQGICPDGWHLPSDYDWYELAYYLYNNQTTDDEPYYCGQNSSNIAKALADNHTENWRTSTETCAVGNNIASNNASGFSAIGYSFAHYNPTNTNAIYSNPKEYTSFWTSTPITEWDETQDPYVVDSVMYKLLRYNEANLQEGYRGKRYLMSVRCLRDVAEGTVQQMQEQIDGLQEQLASQGSKPYVYINSCTSTSNSATVNATASGQGEVLLAKGICWGTSENPTISNNYVLSDETSNSYSYTISDLAFATQYYIRAFATNSNGTSYSSQRTVPTGISLGSNQYVVPTNYSTTITISETIDTGSVWVYDVGGPNSNYNNSCNGYLVIKPGDNSKKVKLVTGTYSTESGFDYIQIYDGTNTTATTGYVNQYTGSGSVTAYTSTAADGSLTIRFISDFSVTRPGFSFMFSMVGPCDGTYSISYDGSTYQTVEIGEQCWLKQNLRNTHYADGTSIPLSSNNTLSTTTAYRYYPGNSSSNVSTYGYLYNWEAISHGESSSTLQGICPTGWHIPSFDEWTQLISYVQSQSQYLCTFSGTNYIAKSLAATTLWDTYSATCSVGNSLSSNNATGFTALPAGIYYANGSYPAYLTQMAYFAIHNNNGNYYNWFPNMRHDSGVFSISGGTNFFSKAAAVSVRCMKD